jgi:hypothetical protein
MVILLSSLSLNESSKFRMVFWPASLLQHPFPDVCRTVQDRDPRRLTRVKKTNTFDIHEIEFLQIQREAWSAMLNLRLQLIKVLRSELPAQTNARLALTSNPLDLQRHGSLCSEEQSNDCNNQAIRNPLQEGKLELRAVLNFQEFLCNEENTLG